MFQVDRPLVLSHRDEIPEIPASIETVHFSFRPSNRDVFILLAKCEHLKSVQMPSHMINKVSESIGEILKMKGIDLKEGMVYERGTAKRILN
jgi:hypothetical protein